MTGFLLRRAVECTLVLVLMSVAVYGLLGLMPGDPVDLMFAADPNLTAADLTRLRAIHGLDQPLWQRYLDWAAGALQGRFGYSRFYNQPVDAVLLPRLGNTLLLMSAAFLLSLAVALPAGLLAAARQGGIADGVLNLICFAGVSVPQFWLALLLIILFSVELGWLPAGGLPVDGGFWETLRHMILPVATLTLGSLAGTARHMRAAALEALRQDYVRTARAKGAGPGRVLHGHVLRNAMLPVATILALDVGTLFSGALVVETVFAWPGMGRTIYDAIIGSDYNLALVGLLFATATTLLGNLAADIAYTALDPRLGFGTRRGAA